MSDDSPWKPPAPGEPEPGSEPPLPSVSAPPEPGSEPTLPPATARPADEAPSLPASPWARGAEQAGVDGPVLPVGVPPSNGFAPPAAAGPITAEPPAGFGTTPEIAFDQPDAAPPKRRSAKAVAVAATVIAAVGLAGIFAVRGLTGETASGGATPDELGEELLDAIDGEDMLGVIDLLLPGERATLGEPIVDTVSELQRLDVLASELDLADIAGFDITLDERTVVVESTNVADVAHVRLSADAIVTVDGADIPIGSLITDNVPDDAMTELRGSRSTENETFDVELTAVEEDGRWYFSTWYSVAEFAREWAGVADIPVEGVGAIGADSPEAVVDRFIDQLEALDVRGMIQSLDPYEAAALQRYAPLVLPEAEAAVADLGEGVFEVTEYDVSYEGSGSARTAFINAIAVEISDDGFLIRFSYSDGCSRVDWSGEGIEQEPIEFCGNDLNLADQMAGIDVPREMELLGQTLTDAFADIEPAGIELRERDGEWYVSPISTVGEAWLGVLRALDRDELDAIIEAAPPAFEAMMNEVLGTGGGMLDQALGGLSGDVTVPDDEWLDENAGSTDAVDGAEGTSSPDPVATCYETVESAAATRCFEAVIASGDADMWVMPVVLRFPECGLADMMWSNDIYTASDDEFVAAITAARPCFGELVTNGTIEGWEVPYEVSEFDCFENRNWYATFDDPDYSDRVAACLEGE